MYKIVVDANIWIKYARTKDIAPLLKRFIQYRLIPIVNNYLLSEIYEALVNNNWMHPADAYNLIAYIAKISIVRTEKCSLSVES